ncbi:hypothetical protein H650_14325 [Enterobacter sp. R4-368]|nr:hypothetical protein H650_14325 [Enterobacter sp. R4-368]
MAQSSGKPANRKEKLLPVLRALNPQASGKANSILMRPFSLVIKKALDRGLNSACLL